MKLERLAGIPGKPEVWAGYDGDWYVCQYSPGHRTAQVYGPVCKDERAAVRAWNLMVERVRAAIKAEGGE